MHCFHVLYSCCDVWICNSLGSYCMRLTHNMMYYCYNVCVRCIGDVDIYLSYYKYISYIRRLTRIELLIYGYRYLDLYYLFSNDSTIKSINLSLDFYLLLSFFITLKDYANLLSLTIILSIIFIMENPCTISYCLTDKVFNYMKYILLHYMFYGGNCIWNDQELSIVIYSNITIMLLYYIWQKVGLGLGIMISYIMTTIADTKHLNILPFGQLNTIVNNDIDNTHSDTFFTTTYDSLGEVDPDINQCLNGRSHRCSE